MSKLKKVLRSKDELKRELVEQLQLLECDCKTFDEGTEAAGKHIGLTLRVLVHEYKQSRALLAQLGLIVTRFYDSAGPLDPSNRLPEHNLILIAMNGSGAKYCAVGDGFRKWRRVRFQEWWNEPVIKDMSKTFSRRNLILHVADTDGGAHVDPGLDEDYHALSRGNSLEWMFASDDLKRPVEGRPELACMRQIAYEVLCTIRDFMPEFGKSIMAVSPMRKLG